LQRRYKMDFSLNRLQYIQKRVVSVHFVGLGSFTRGREGSSTPRVNEKAFTREFFPNLIFSSSK